MKKIFKIIAFFVVILLTTFYSFGQTFQFDLISSSTRTNTLGPTPCITKKYPIVMGFNGQPGHHQDFKYNIMNDSLLICAKDSTNYYTFMAGLIDGKGLMNPIYKGLDISTPLHFSSASQQECCWFGQYNNWFVYKGMPTDRFVDVLCNI